MIEDIFSMLACGFYGYAAGTGLMVLLSHLPL